jgi:hypothetical protein
MTGQKRRDELRRNDARRSVLWSSALDLGVGIAGALAFRGRSGVVVWAMVQFAAAGALGLLVALSWRRAPRAVGLALFSLNVTSGLFTGLVSADALARLGQPSGLFQSLEAGMIVIAVLSPAAGLGVAWIAVFVAAPLLQVGSWPETIRQSIAPRQTWFVIIYGGIAIALLLYRQRSVELERALAETEAARLSARRLAQVSLAVRDLANTQLQTLSTAVLLLRHKVERQELVLDAMNRALGRLEVLKQALAPLDEQLDWHSDAESFDAVERIQQVVAEVGSQRPRR